MQLAILVSCVKSAADTPMSPDEEDALRQHGLKSSALGDNCPTWLKKFAAMQVLTWSVSREGGRDKALFNLYWEYPLCRK